MDSFNSQLLSPQDGYYRLFDTATDYHWGVGNVGAYVLHVKPGTGPGVQTDIKLTMDPASGMYKPAATEVTIKVNDFVLWHVESTDPASPPFSIVGIDDKSTTHVPTFRNSSLTHDDAYSHLFLGPGTYQYLISGGTGGAQTGTVIISSETPPPTRNPQGWLVKVKDGTPPDPTMLPKAGDPPIFPGDTVHWDIDASVGCVIRVVS